MNALYVTVSIPILLVLAGFNHAHGLTTFGKSNGQGQANSGQQSTVQAKHCISQANCSFVRGTTCLRQYCLCGDNTHPANGKCSATHKGQGHICEKDEECVENALCLLQDEQPNDNGAPTPSPDKICQCLNNKSTARGTCSGGANVVVIPGLLLVSMLIAKAF